MHPHGMQPPREPVVCARYLLLRDEARARTLADATTLAGAVRGTLGPSALCVLDPDENPGARMRLAEAALTRIEDEPQPMAPGMDPSMVV